tara:strand:- start:39 stop:518 length:480 start_codon:yes stop_codon:yes gene_type:complete
LATRYNNRKIITSQQTIPIGKLLPGMIVTFNYSEEGVVDPRPILLFLYHNKGRRVFEGLNLNYINPAKINKLFTVIDFKKGVTGMENLIALKEDYFRVQISNIKARSHMTSKKFYDNIILADNVFKSAYRSYKVNVLSSLKVINIIDDLIHKPGGAPSK